MEEPIKLGLNASVHCPEHPEYEAQILDILESEALKAIARTVDELEGLGIPILGMHINESDEDEE